MAPKLVCCYGAWVPAEFSVLYATATMQWSMGPMVIGMPSNGCVAMGPGWLQNTVPEETLQCYNGPWAQWLYVWVPVGVLLWAYGVCTIILWVAMHTVNGQCGPIAIGVVPIWVCCYGFGGLHNSVVGWSLSTGNGQWACWV